LSNVILSRENFECKYLDWDTEYFGVKSARVNLFNVVSESEQEEIINFCSDYSFVTISNIDNQNENNLWLSSKTKSFLVDMNIQLIKNLKGIQDINSIENISIEAKYEYDEKLIEIAKNSFNHSRFFNDPNLPINLARNIYSYWTKCAFENEKKFFVIYKDKEATTGYILFSLHDDYCLIELIAVNSEYQGMRIGYKMINKLESYLVKQNITKIKVGTQVNNLSAIRFYTSCGFEFNKCGSMYHLWKD